jgi:AraC-like DNA-binding protein
VSVVLVGGYVEAGDGGRVRAQAGTVIVHKAYAAHLNTFEAPRSVVLNLVGGTRSPLIGAGVIDDVDEIVRVAEHDTAAAVALIMDGMRSEVARFSDWPDLLAEALTRNPELSIAEWADGMKLNPASVSRGFRRCFGVSPKRFRLEAKARNALRGIANTTERLSLVAASCGFADQAHLNRTCLNLTGETPAAFRAKSVQ